MIDLNHKAESELFSQLAHLLITDYDLDARARETWLQPNADDLAAAVWNFVSNWPIIYTAFDGDHQYLSGQMRSVVLELGGVPANPESILGYKETVEARTSKKGVLLDDVAILSSCDELWVFTEARCSPAVVRELAEGVVIELLYFLKKRPLGRVVFISPIDLLRGNPPRRREFGYDFSEVIDELSGPQSEIRDFVERATKASHLRTLVYHIFDPLDFKYARWLQADCYNRRKAPLLPNLAIDLQDTHASQGGIGRVIAAWTRLMSLTGRAYVFPPFTKDRTPSLISSFLVSAWNNARSPLPIQHRSWRDYRIPRAQDPGVWAITRKERARPKSRPKNASVLTLTDDETGTL